MRRRRNTAAILVCLTGMLCVIRAQQIAVTGTVTDAAGKGIAGAIVSLVAAQKNATTDSLGAYSITGGFTNVNGGGPYCRTVPQPPWFDGRALSFSVNAGISKVCLDVYTLSGRHVLKVFESPLTHGDYHICPFANNLPAQQYVLRLSVGSQMYVVVAPFAYRAPKGSSLVRGAPTDSRSLAKAAASLDSFLVWAVGYNVLAQSTDTYSGTINFVLQKTVGAGSVQVVQTSPAGDFLAAEPALTFATDDGSSLPTVTIDTTHKYQAILGFGGAFTEAATSNLSKIGAQKRAAILKSYFSPYFGSGYTVCRTNLQSCDFCVAKYSYDSIPGDYALNNFSIQHETQWMIPTIKEAMTVPGAAIKIFASPWSPSAWMKTNNNMLNGGSLLPACANAWALFFVKYIEAMDAAGIPIWGVTIQNEPEATQTWESCIYTAASERDFLKNNLGPALADNHVDVKVMIFDHNKDHVATWASTILGDTAAAKYAWGTAFHWYSGDQFENVSTTHDNFPAKHLLASEEAWGLPMYNWTIGEMYAHDIIGDLNSWAEGWVEWNLVLDQNGMPRHDPYTGCASSVDIDFNNDSVHYNPSYFYIAHFSRYLRPGALRISCVSNSPSLETTAFANTNGRIAVVAYNNTAAAISFKIKQGTQIVKPTIPAHGIMDFIY
jgi:glucosylceramidase